ncbi:MAG: alpha/beta fold hydrolase [Treponema sp.]|nr:alpha/beta fold hydrolase [Treponema sp.]
MEQIIDVNSIKIWTETFGNYNGKAIILISGAMAPGIFWDKTFCNELAKSGYFVIRFDNRDIGFSTHFEPCRPNSSIQMPYSIGDMVEDVYGILKYYNINKANIVGHSLGCTIAQLFAIKYTEETGNLFLISSPIIATGKNKYVETDEKIKEKMWAILMSNKMYQDYERGKNEYFRIWKYLNGKWHFDENMAEEYTKRLYKTEYIEPAWNHTKVQENIKDIFMELNNLNKKIHFIYGEIDYLPSNLESIKVLVKSLKNADLEIIPNGGHMFFNKNIWEDIIRIFKEKLL